LILGLAHQALFCRLLRRLSAPFVDAEIDLEPITFRRRVGGLYIRRIERDAKFVCVCSTDPYFLHTVNRALSPRSGRQNKAWGASPRI